MKTIFGIKGFEIGEYAISANAILGIRDSGKTYTATEAAEELYDARIPFIALDPIGVWHSLRIPGAGKGYPVVVAGGKHSDLPLTVKTAGAIVRAAMVAGVSLVLDLFSMELSKADWRRIVRETVEILLHENAEYGLRHVFIEEAAEFVPQRPQDMLVFSAVEKLVRMGGNSKLGCTLINQRSADLNKSVLELCANVFVHRQKGKNTILDLKKWFTLLDLSAEEEKKIADSLPDLKSGKCWAFINDLKKPVFLQVPQKNSLHPDRRAAAPSKAEAARRAPVAADEFVAAMQAALAEKAKPVIRQAAPALSSKTSRPVENLNIAATKADKRAIAASYEEGQRSIRAMIPAMLDAQHEASFEAGYRVAAITGTGLLQGMKSAMPAIDRPVTRQLKTLLSQHAPPGTGGNGAQDAQQARPAPAAQPAAPRPAQAPPSAGGLEKPLQRIVNAIRWWNVFGLDAPSHNQVAFIANYVPGSGTWNRYLSALRSGGIIEARGDLKLTQAGFDRATEPDLVPTGDSLRAAVLAKIDAPLVRILNPLLGAFPEGMSHDDVAAAANYVAGSGTWNRYLSSLRSLDLIEKKGELKAQGWLFP